MTLDEMRTCLRLAEEDELADGRVPSEQHPISIARALMEIVEKIDLQKLYPMYEVTRENGRETVIRRIE